MDKDIVVLGWQTVGAVIMGVGICQDGRIDSARIRGVDAITTSRKAIPSFLVKSALGARMVGCTEGMRRAVMRGYVYGHAILIWTAKTGQVARTAFSHVTRKEDKRGPFRIGFGRDSK